MRVNISVLCELPCVIIHQGRISLGNTTWCFSLFRPLIFLCGAPKTPANLISVTASKRELNIREQKGRVYYSSSLVSNTRSLEQERFIAETFRQECAKSVDSPEMDS